MQEQYNTVIIGGGISGLCLAHRLVHTFGLDDLFLLEASDLGKEAGLRYVYPGVWVQNAPNTPTAKASRFLSRSSARGLGHAEKVCSGLREVCHQCLQAAAQLTTFF